MSLSKMAILWNFGTVIQMSVKWFIVDKISSIELGGRSWFQRNAWIWNLAKKTGCHYTQIIRIVRLMWYCLLSCVRWIWLWCVNVELQIKAMKHLFLCEAEVHVQSFMLKSVVLKIKPFDLYESSTSNFSLQYRPHFIHESHENIGIWSPTWGVLDC